MNPRLSYQQSSTVGMTRIELVLALYENLIQFLEQARGHLERKEDSAARPLLVKAQLAVTGLAAGVDAQEGDLAAAFARLYEYVLYSITAATPVSLSAALETIRSLQEGFQQIRQPATDLERSGGIPSLDQEQVVRAKA